MNIAYIRKTDKPVAEVAKNFKEHLINADISIIGEKNIDGSNGVIIYFFKPSWAEKIAAEDYALIGLMPDEALIHQKEGKTIIGISNPKLVAGGPSFREIEPVAKEMDKALRGAVNEAAGLGEPKIEKVKLYSTETCPYCKMEKSYLEKNNVDFDLVMVDSDRKAAEEMVRKTGQTGVPITEIIFDDGDSEMVLGFDKDRLDDLLKIGAK